MKGRHDPWAAMDEVAQSIAPLLEMVEADEERGLGDMPYPPNFSGKWVCAACRVRRNAEPGVRYGRLLRSRAS
jgi:hypothetical protein